MRQKFEVLVLRKSDLSASTFRGSSLHALSRSVSLKREEADESRRRGTAGGPGALQGLSADVIGRLIRCSEC